MKLYKRAQGMRFGYIYQKTEKGMKTIQICVVLVILLVGIRIIESKEVKDMRLIETTCKNTPHYKLCMSIIMADSSSPGKVIQDLALVVVAHMKKTVIEMVDKIERLKQGSPKEVVAALQKCKDIYEEVVDVLIPEAERATWGNPKFAENAVADIKIEARLCENGFQHPSPLSADNKYLQDVSDVARGVIRNLL